MIYKEDFEEHDHEVICSWDCEREKYEKRIKKLEERVSELYRLLINKNCR